MTRGEFALGGCVLNNLEVLQVRTLAELIVVRGIAVVHHYPGLAVDALAHANSLHLHFCLVNMRLMHCPLTAKRLSWLSSKCFGSGLEYSASTLALEQ